MGLELPNQLDRNHFDYHRIVVTFLTCQLVNIQYETTKLCRYSEITQEISVNINYIGKSFDKKIKEI